jgi:uncharacterized membrane protein
MMLPGAPYTCVASRDATAAVIQTILTIEFGEAVEEVVDRLSIKLYKYVM